MVKERRSFNLKITIRFGIKDGKGIRNDETGIIKKV